MILLWTKSKLIGSKVIRYGLDEPVSHYATAFIIGKKTGIVLNQRANGGFKIEWLSYFLKKNQIVYALSPLNIDSASKSSLLIEMMNEFSGTFYDTGSLIYFCWRVFLRKFFDVPLPAKSLWGDDKYPLCTGHGKVLYRLMPRWFSTKPNDFDITSPYSLYLNLKASGQFKNAVI